MIVRTWNSRSILFTLALFEPHNTTLQPCFLTFQYIGQITNNFSWNGLSCLCCKVQKYNFSVKITLYVYYSMHL